MSVFMDRQAAACLPRICTAQIIVWKCTKVITTSLSQNVYFKYENACVCAVSTLDNIITHEKR